jgi:hypothetical protein
MNALLSIGLIVGIILGVVGLMALVAWLTRPRKPKVDKSVTIFRLIEKPTMEARQTGQYEYWQGVCTVCGVHVAKERWIDWENFLKWEQEAMLAHKCPTVEEVIKNAPKWERVDGRRSNRSNRR